MEDQAGERGVEHTPTPFQTEDRTSVSAASVAKEAEKAPQPATGTGLLAPLRLRGGSREVEGLLFSCGFMQFSRLSLSSLKGSTEVFVLRHGHGASS